jgi:two-component system phosphate regulon sensor histidine kinase PhoR
MIMGWAVSVVLAVVCVFIIVRHYHYTKQIRKINHTLNQFTQTNHKNVFFRLRTKEEELVQLGKALNNLIKQIDANNERANSLEIIHKQVMTHIAHDLRTPLTSILGYIEMLKEDASLSDDTRQEYLNIIFSKAQRLTKLAQDFFTLAKLEAGDTMMKFQRVNLTVRLQEILVSFYQEFLKLGIEPKIEVPDQSVYVWADPNSIERILNNLISNSLRYGNEGGEFGIAIRIEQEKVWIDIWDRGQGISKADLPYIFERLYTGEASRNHHLQGNGLGLSITRKLVEKLKGEIFVESIPYKETKFSFYLLRFFDSDSFN